MGEIIEKMDVWAVDGHGFLVSWIASGIDLGWKCVVL